ncbi:MAG: S-ribosylhomocysteine lyase [Kiritimatiellia bacterium]
MNLIESFQVDHTKIVPGIYVSRRDRTAGGWITTFDIRMKKPNAEPAVHPNAMHTIEHIVATYLRNSDFREHVVYWGPMGCLTGFYFIVQTAHEIRPQEIAQLIRDAYRHQANYTGEVPGATAAGCGNFRLHDLQMAKWEAKAFLARPWKFAYPKTRRIVTKGKVFFDA